MQTAAALVLSAAGLTTLIVRHLDWGLDALFAHVTALGARRALVTHLGAPFVEVAATGVIIASALAVLCARRGIAQDEGGASASG